MSIPFKSTMEGVTSLKASRLQQLTGYHTVPELPNNSEIQHVENVYKSNPNKKDLLLLLPANEKFVSSFVQPTLLPFPDLYDMNKCAEFVSRYVTYEPLELDSISIVSPSQTLDWAVGDCFDMSFLLASLLIGAGFDANVVQGEAPSWLRLKDQSHMQVDKNSTGSPIIRIKDDCYHQKETRGEGIHCWVLIKAGKREIDKCCFVEPSTGIFYAIDNSPYTQIFSVCNDQNCWVNIENAGGATKGFDFANSTQWKSVLPDSHSALPTDSKLSLPKEKHLLRYPSDGKRAFNVDHGKIELFGDGVHPQGIVSRVTVYEDTARTIAVEQVELFSPSQTDHMTKRVRRPLENSTTENFSVKNALFPTTRVCVEGAMTSLKFLPKTRVDGLVHRIEEFSEDGVSSIVTEHFLHKTDKLVRRVIHVSTLPHNTEQPKAVELFPSSDGSSQRSIDQIDFHYDTPTDTSKEKTVACRSFVLKECTVRESYHCEHDILKTENMYNIKDVGEHDTRGKELVQMMNVTISSVKSVQSEMLGVTKSPQL